MFAVLVALVLLLAGVVGELLLVYFNNWVRPPGTGAQKESGLNEVQDANPIGNTASP